MNHLFSRQCIQCDGSVPSCNCAPDEQCVLTSRTCSQCPSIQCNKRGDSGGGGVNPGVIAAPIAAVLIVASLALFWWLRRKKRRDLERLEQLAARAKKAESAGFHLSTTPGSPTPGSARSAVSGGTTSRSTRRSQLPPPPPSANPRRVSDRSPAAYNERHDPSAAYDRSPDPFEDNHSVSTSESKGSGNAAHYLAHSDSSGNLRSPTGESDEGGISAAARRLDEARQNLWRPGQPPSRPARAPGLDLRAPSEGRSSPYDSLRSPGTLAPGGIRDSYVSNLSGAPSFLSGTSDLHLDAPKIFTSKQVQIGRLQQAEVVQWGSPSNANAYANASANAGPSASPRSPNATRTLTPRQFDDSEEGMLPDPPSAGASGDLRFSMGSLAYRDSVSTMGTGRYLAARPDSNLPSHAGVPPPRSPGTDQPRESIVSNRSYADSVLSGFPMIPPGNSAPSLPGSSIPQSSSTATMLSAQYSQTPSRPPPAFKDGATVPTPGRQRGSRPTTTASVADSFLGTFPFVPPNMDDLAGLPSAALPSAAMPETAMGGARNVQAGGRNAQGMSSYSEGLGGFDFKMDGDTPPVPKQ